jgi:cytidylate kinase
MRALTISRELGSLGTSIAQVVAERLGYRLMWREVINEAAASVGSPEIALSEIDDLGLLGLRPSEQAFKAYHRAVRSIIEELASEGHVVILGRAGQVILQEHPDVFHIKILAPLEARVHRIASRRNISQKAARAQIEQSDRTRRCYLRRHYDVEWRNPELYDLIINTLRMDVDTAATVIEDATTSLRLESKNLEKEGHLDRP